MKKIVVLMIILTCFFSQEKESKDLTTSDLSSLGDPKKGNEFSGGLGMANIDGKNYFAFTLTPELAFGNFGMGLNLELFYNDQDGLYTKHYETGAGWLKSIRYLRYGQKGEELFIRAGALDNGTLGNGFLMFHYNNQANYEARKLGLQFDLDFKDYGFESLYSNFGRAEILGFRGYYRPLADSEMPILNTLETGVTYITDLYANPYDSVNVDNSISAMGFDANVKLLKLSNLTWKFYVDYGKIMKYGNGVAIGSSFIIPDVFGLLQFGAKYEYRSVGDKFVPSLFNAGYELNRLKNPISKMISDAKSSSGYFGELAMGVLSTVYIKGNYQKLDGIENGGIFYAQMIAPSLGEVLEVSAKYSKTNLNGADEIFTFNENSIADFEVGYQLNSFLFISTIYRYTWKEVFDAGNNSRKFESQKTIIPQVKFRFVF